MVVSLAAQVVFMLLASIPLSWFSRRREFRADADSAQLAGKEKMIAALEALKRYQNQSQKLPDDQLVPEAVAALAII
jgi:heat shock protein HtpX